MQSKNSQTNVQAIRSTDKRQRLAAFLKKMRRPNALLLATLATLAFSGCASLPPSHNDANGCVGPVSYCNIFFGS